MKTIKYAFKEEWYNILMLLLPFLAVPFLWSYMPDKVPMHWNIQGEVDNCNSKAYGLLFLPLLNLGVYLLLLFIHKIDPEKIAMDQKPIPMLRTFTVLLLFCVQTYITSSSLNTGISTGSLYLLIAFFIVLIGNYLPSLQPNYFVGIRLPWTLEEPLNWRKTHRLGSCCWVAGGLLLIILFPILPESVYYGTFTGIILVIVIIPSAYSFYLYKTNS